VRKDPLPRVGDPQQRTGKAQERRSIAEHLSQIRVETFQRRVGRSQKQRSQHQADRSNAHSPAHPARALRARIYLLEQEQQFGKIEDEVDRRLARFLGIAAQVEICICIDRPANPVAAPGRAPEATPPQARARVHIAQTNAPGRHGKIKRKGACPSARPLRGGFRPRRPGSGCVEIQFTTRRTRRGPKGKIVIFRDPERSVLEVREHRKRGKARFADRHGLNVDTA
jgi:hypothetical protein